MIWYTVGPDKLESAWIRATAPDTYEVLATRPEAVVSNGAHVWAVQRLERHVPMADCPEEAGDDDVPAPPPDGPTVLVTALRLQPLGPGAVRELAPMPDEPFFVGDYSEDLLALHGSIDDRVIYHHAEFNYTCGAHPDWWDVTIVKRPGEDDPRGWWERLAPQLAPKRAEWKKKLMAELAKDGDCASIFEGDDPDIVDVGFEKKGDALFTRWVWSLWTESHAVRACSIELPELGPLGALDAFPAPATLVAKALKERAGEGAFGWSKLALAPDVHDAALAAFRDASTVFVPVPQPKPADTTQRLLEEARELTAKRNYKDAIAAFKKVLRAHPGLARAESGLGYAYLLAGDDKNARTAFGSALELDRSPPFQAAVHFNLGLLDKRAGDLAAARKQFQTSLALRHSDEVQQALDALDAKPK